MDTVEDLLSNIRNKNADLADKLNSEHMLDINYLKIIYRALMPIDVVPELKLNKGVLKLNTIDELIKFNFSHRKTSKLKAIFVFNLNGKLKTISISICTLRALEAVFKTHGRFPEEIDALHKLQLEMINNILNIRTKESIITFLKHLSKGTNLFNLIIETLIQLCEQQQ